MYLRSGLEAVKLIGTAEPSDSSYHVNGEVGGSGSFGGASKL